MTKTLMVGCPVRDRAWIIERWHWHVTQAIKNLPEEYDVKFVFVCSPNDDTVEALVDHVHPDDLLLHYSTEDDKRYVRTWNTARYEQMAFLRNELLGVVRAFGPDLFVSLDSDILAHPDSLANIVQTLTDKGAWAVGGKAYLEEVGTRCPTYGVWNTRHKHTTFRRPDADYVVAADILMAYVVMTPAAYLIDYRSHDRGEDLGWSSAMAGHPMYWDGRVCSKHVMTRDWLDQIDKRCGY